MRDSFGREYLILRRTRCDACAKFVRGRCYCVEGWLEERLSIEEGLEELTIDRECTEIAEQGCTCY